MFPKSNQNYLDTSEGGRKESNLTGTILQTIPLTFRCYLNCAPFKPRRALLHATDLNNRHSSKRRTLASYDRFYTSIIRRLKISRIIVMNKNQFIA